MSDVRPVERKGGGSHLAFFVVLAVVLVAMGAGYFLLHRQETGVVTEAKRQSQEGFDRAVGMAAPTARTLNKAKFSDADNNLIADTPKDAAKLLDPATLSFSFVSVRDAAEHKRLWKPFMDHLSAVTGKPVSYFPARTIGGQLRGLQSRALHVTAVNSGSVPLAVNELGFVPLFTLGGTGYHTLVIVPSGSSIGKLEDLRNHELALVDPLSSSGYKVPLIELRRHGLLPSIDFDIRLSYEQKASIEGIAARRYQAAAVASDVLQREERAGTIAAGQYKVVYRSEKYPQLAFGCVHDLTPELVKKIRTAFETFTWDGTELQKTLSPAGQATFAATDYANDWESVRKVADSISLGYRVPEGSEEPAELAPATGPGVLAPATGAGAGGK